MRLKNICIFSLLGGVFLLLGCCSCKDGVKPSENRITKKFSVDPFDQIVNETVANIVFTQGRDTKVEAEGPDNYVDGLQVKVNDRRLTMTMDKKKFSKNARLTIRITSPDLCLIQQGGVGNITLKDNVKVETLSIRSEGVGVIESENLTVRSLEVSQDGVGGITLKGRAETAKYYQNGVGSLKAQEMLTSDLVVEQNGVGSVSCYATENLSVDANGVGSVNYYGNPRTKDIRKSGVGSVSGK